MIKTTARKGLTVRSPSSGELGGVSRVSKGVAEVYWPGSSTSGFISVSQVVVVHGPLEQQGTWWRNRSNS